MTARQIAVQPASVMSQHSNDSFDSAYCAVSLECSACTCKPQSLHCSSSGHEETVDAVVLAACFDIWRIPLWRSNRVVWSPCRRGGQRCGTSLRRTLVHICDAFHDPQGVRLGSGQMSCGMGEWAERNGCGSDPGRWTKRLQNRDPPPSISNIIFHLFFSQNGPSAQGKASCDVLPSISSSFGALEPAAYAAHSEHLHHRLYLE